MDSVNMVLDFANIVNVIAVLLLMRAIIKERKVLKGFSISGSFLTFVAILGFEIAYILLGNLISVGLGLVTLVFWFLVFIFNLRRWIYEHGIIGENGTCRQT
jgi:energy-converting hydrogenase Eha subunit A